MEAQVTIKLSPQEFDTVRNALKELRASSLRAADNLDASAPDRRTARQLALTVGQMLEKLQ